MAKTWSEVSIKVAAPFAGIADLGFTTQYRSQALSEKLQDVPFVIEGPSRPLTRLAEYLHLLGGEKGLAYAWSEPVMLSDEVVVLALKDRSLVGDEGRASGEEQLSRYVFNLAKPAVFTFLQDCARVAELRLSEMIEMQVTAKGEPRWQVVFASHEIVKSNGCKLLWQLA